MVVTSGVTVRDNGDVTPVWARPSDQSALKGPVPLNVEVNVVESPAYNTFGVADKATTGGTAACMRKFEEYSDVSPSVLPALLKFVAVALTHCPAATVAGTAKDCVIEDPEVTISIAPIKSSPSVIGELSTLFTKNSNLNVLAAGSAGAVAVIMRTSFVGHESADVTVGACCRLLPSSNKLIPLLVFKKSVLPKIGFKISGEPSLPPPTRTPKLLNLIVFLSAALVPPMELLLLARVELT